MLGLLKKIVLNNEDRMRKITADYIYPVNMVPIKNGVVHISDSGEILYVGDSLEGDEEYYKGIICPGFVNVHCHTELSFAKNKIEQGGGIDSFIGSLEKIKRNTSDIIKNDAVANALLEMSRNGIVAVGDIMNTDLSLEAKSNSGIKFYNFIEIFGSQDSAADKAWQNGISLFDKATVPKNIIPHAPYSLSLTLFEKIKDFQSTESTISIHHKESEGEGEYFEKASGAMADRFKSWGMKIPPHIPSGKSPIESIGNYLQNNDKVLLIHNTFINEKEVDFAKENFKETYYGLCPNANLYIENKLPPVDLLKEMDVNICIGTDSLASNNRLSIIDELRVLKSNFDISNDDLIRWATINGAKALGFDLLLGSIEVGKKPGLVLLDKELNLIEVIV